MMCTTKLWIVGILILGIFSCNGGRSVATDAPLQTKPAGVSDVPSSKDPDTPLSPPNGVSPASLFENSGRAVRLGAPKRYENLTLFPLLAAPPANEGSLRPLDEAMDKGSLVIKEQEEETVSTLKVRNSGDKSVFIMTGEIVTGAKQDRMSAHDVLIPIKSKTLALSVYCVEQGRWVNVSDRFSSGKIAGTTSLRKMAAKKSSQGTIWSKVKEKSDEAAVSSDTGAMRAVYNDPGVKQRASAFEKAFSSWATDQKDMVGIAAAIDGRVVSADLFYDRTLLQALFPKLLRATAIDAVTSTAPSSTSPIENEVRKFLQEGFGASRTKTENPGMGEEFLIDAGHDLNGTVLIYNGEIVHLSLFSAERQNNPRALGPSLNNDSIPTLQAALHSDMEINVDLKKPKAPPSSSMTGSKNPETVSPKQKKMSSKKTDSSLHRKQKVSEPY